MKKTLLFSAALLWGAALLLGQTAHKLESVTEDTVVYWIIDTPEDLIWFCDTLSLDADNDGTDDFADKIAKFSGNFRLGADITFDPDETKVDWNNDGVIDISASDSSGLWPAGYWRGADDWFRGTFNGQYYTIANIYKAHWDRNGLFGNISGATIQNVKLTNLRIDSPEDYNGGIAARGRTAPDNLIKRCYVEGSIKANRTAQTQVYIGGIVGRYEFGEIIECAANVTLEGSIASANRRIGGIVGDCSESITIKDCYAVGSLIGDDHTGGIVGRGDDPVTWSIKNCYAAVTLTVTDGKENGGFAGEIEAGVTLESCYWDNTLEATAIGDDKGFIGTLSGLATAFFASEANFSGWDFAETWMIGDVAGTQRPMLKWQNLSGGSSTAVKNLANQSLLKAYPNPASTMLTIENAPVNVEYRLMNMIGQTVESGLVSSSRMMLNVENYSKGVYLLKVGDSVNKILIK